MSSVEKLAADLRLILWLSIFLYCVLSLAQAVFGLGMDDSDASNFKRSGLKLHTDYLTGCQYFQAPNGGLIPRVDATGGHICVMKGN